MIPFSLQIPIYRLKQIILKLLLIMVPFPKPIQFLGSGSSLEMCKAIQQMGIKKVLIVTDAMLTKLGVFDPVKQKLEELGIEYLVYDGVEPNPSIQQIEAGLDMYKSNQCDGLLAIGGGSSLDAAKVIAARATHPKKTIRKMDGLFKLRGGIDPLFVIPTTAGTGSEVTIAAVVSDPDNKRKFAIMDPKLMPEMCALDGTLQTGLPPHITAATGMDAMTHAVEAFISRNALPYTDRQALAAVKLIVENLPKVMADGNDLEARSNMAIASFYAGLAFTAAGVGYVHAIAHNFGAYYHTPHGLANAIVLPYVLDFSKPACTDRLAILARTAGLDTGGLSDEQLADEFIAHIRKMCSDFDIPNKLDALKQEDIPGIAKAACKEAHWTYAVPRYMPKKDMQQFLGQILS